MLSPSVRNMYVQHSHSPSQKAVPATAHAEAPYSMDSECRCSPLQQIPSPEVDQPRPVLVLADPPSPLTECCAGDQSAFPTGMNTHQRLFGHVTLATDCNDVQDGTRYTIKAAVALHKHVHHMEQAHCSQKLQAGDKHTSPTLNSTTVCLLDKHFDPTCYRHWTKHRKKDCIAMQELLSRASKEY